VEHQAAAFNTPGGGLRMGAYLQIENLAARFGTFALGPLSMELGKGDYLVLLGPAGCGKTSLLRTLAGIAPLWQGNVVLDGLEISTLPPERRRVGYVPQHSELFPHLSVEENLAFGLAYAGLSRKELKGRVGRYLSLFGLEAFSRRYPGTLSGGESKKVAIARSLIVEPRLLLLDEPLGMLDHNGRREVLDTLRMVHEELGATAVHVTHDRHEAWRIAQTCGVMSDGLLRQLGGVAELFRIPRSRFVAEFLGGTNIFPAEFNGCDAKLDWANFDLGFAPGVPRGWVLLRPERIRLAADGEQFQVRGTLRSIRDYGEFIELEVSVAGDTAILALHIGIDSGVSLLPGAELHLAWNRDAAHPLLED